MGLTKDDKTVVSVSMDMLLLEFVKGIASLTSDPKALDKKIIEANALSDVEQKKYQKAIDEISRYETLILQNKQQLTDISIKLSDLAHAQKDLDEKIQLNSAKEIELNKFKRSLDDREKQLDALSGILDKEKSELKSDNEVLTRERATFNSEKNEFAVFEKNLREKAEKLRAEASGL